MVSKRYAVANNDYVSDYDPSQPSVYVLSYDAVNLYGTSMRYPLPTGNLRFLDSPDEFDYESVDLEGESGYLLEVNLQYPPELHEKHDSYPVAAEHLDIKPNMLSEYNADDSNFLGQTLLVPNLRDKQNYVLHIPNLRLYAELGLKVTKIHRVLAFDQSTWLRVYIDFNTEKRKFARSDFERELYKLMSNAIYGKSIESVRKRSNVKLVCDPNKAKKAIRKPTCQKWEHVNSDLIMIQSMKPRVLMEKQIYIGTCVLEISKTIMYQFYYQHMLNRYAATDIDLLYTDTDSLTYEIRTRDVYRDMLADIDKFDTSDYPRTHFLYSETNRKRLGCFKDENSKSSPIKEFCGLRSKMYSVLFDDGDGKLTAKGIPKTYRNKTCDTKNSRERCVKKATFRRIKARNHRLQTVQITKISLSSYD